jgi:uncharacterized protein (UPF0333 family)
MGRRGQASVEYMLLICAMLTTTCLVGYFLLHYADVLVDKIGERLLDAALAIALG